MEPLLREIWVRNRGLTTERVALLRAAVCSLERDGSLVEAERAEALSTAHKLAGVLGTFGFPQGTDAARRIEQLLDSGKFTRGDAERLSAWVTCLEEVAVL